MNRSHQTGGSVVVMTVRIFQKETAGTAERCRKRRR